MERQAGHSHSSAEIANYGLGTALQSGGVSFEHEKQHFWSSQPADTEFSRGTIYKRTGAKQVDKNSDGTWTLYYEGSSKGVVVSDEKFRQMIGYEDEG